VFILSAGRGRQVNITAGSKRAGLWLKLAEVNDTSHDQIGVQATEDALFDGRAPSKTWYSGFNWRFHLIRVRRQEIRHSDCDLGQSALSNKFWVLDSLAVASVNWPPRFKSLWLWRWQIKRNRGLFVLQSRRPVQESKSCRRSLVLD